MAAYSMGLIVIYLFIITKECYDKNFENAFCALVVFLMLSPLFGRALGVF